MDKLSKFPTTDLPFAPINKPEVIEINSSIRSAFRRLVASEAPPSQKILLIPMVLKCFMASIKSI